MAEGASAKGAPGGPEPVRFDLGAFQRLAAVGDPRALAMLRQVLAHVEGGGDARPEDGSDDGDGDTGDTAAAALCASLAEAVVPLLAHPDLALTFADCDWLAHHDQHLAAVLRMAGADGPGRARARLAAALGNPGAGVPLRRMLALSGIASGADVDWRDLLAREPDAAFPFFLANFTHRMLLDEAAEQRRDGLFELAPMLADIALRASAMPLVSQAWMLCSYARAPERHSLKPPLNAMVRGLLARDGIAAPDLPQPRPIDDRPTVVVVAEVLFRQHAIYKTYAHFLDQLRGRFRLVLVTVAGHADAAAAALFDDVIQVRWPAGALWSAGCYRDVTAAVAKLAPAMVYFPSLGLTQFSIVLGNLRLAPIQIASVGHPATSHSPYIDYMVMGREYFAGDDRYSERVMLLRSGGALFTPEDDGPPPEPTVRENPDVLRVAVPASPMKIGASFLALCRRAAEESGRKVEYRFFPNLTGLRHLDCRRGIEARLPGARVYPRLAHDDYLAAMGQCDLRFGTYPFGGANTSVDAFRLGLPTLVMDGPEPHSRTDARLVRLFGLPDWLIAGDEAAYEAAALRLIRDDDARSRLARQIIESDPDAVLFQREQNLYPTDFVDCLWWLYENHERVQEQPKRAWSFEDRQSLGPG